MGYESKLYVCNRYKIYDDDDETIRWCSNETVAMVNMGVVDGDFVNLFNKELDGHFFSSETFEEVTEDRYGDTLKCAQFDDVFNWLENEIKRAKANGETVYRRYNVLYSTLLGFKLNGWNELVVVHYGY